MFSLQIVDTDAFLEMPQSSQLLYFHLSMRADDEGFVSSPKKIMKVLGSGEDDIKVLLAKRFIISFESGVVVIKHWKIHNYIQNDRFKATAYINEKKALITKENGAYTECIQNVSTLDTQVRIGKVRLCKVSLVDTPADAGSPNKKIIDTLIEEFETINPTINYGHKNHRKCLEEMLKKFGEEKLRSTIKYAVGINGQKYAPVITNPYQLKERMGDLLSYYKKENNNNPIII